MKVMVETNNLNLKVNGQEKSETKLNHVLQGHGSFPDMEFVLMGLLRFVQFEHMFA